MNYILYELEENLRQKHRLRRRHRHREKKPRDLRGINIHIQLIKRENQLDP